MLLVRPPTPSILLDVVGGLVAGEHSREAVASWQKAVFATCRWQIPVTEVQGYWYFYSLAFADLSFPGGYFLRESDFAAYLADMQMEPGDRLSEDIRHLRSFELNPNQLRWPLAIIADRDDLMSRLPGTRGTFEKRLDMVEHCHLEYRECHYLLVKQFDEQTGEVLLLGSERDREQAVALLTALGIRDYMLP